MESLIGDWYTDVSSSAGGYARCRASDAYSHSLIRIFCAREPADLLVMLVCIRHHVTPNEWLLRVVLVLRLSLEVCASLACVHRRACKPADYERSEHTLSLSSMFDLSVESIFTEPCVGLSLEFRHALFQLGFFPFEFIFFLFELISFLFKSLVDRGTFPLARLAGFHRVTVNTDSLTVAGSRYWLRLCLRLRLSHATLHSWASTKGIHLL